MIDAKKRVEVLSMSILNVLTAVDWRGDWFPALYSITFCSFSPQNYYYYSPVLITLPDGQTNRVRASVCIEFHFWLHQETGSWVRIEVELVRRRPRCITCLACVSDNSALNLFSEWYRIVGELVPILWTFYVLWEEYCAFCGREAESREYCFVWCPCVDWWELR